MISYKTAVVIIFQISVNGDVVYALTWEVLTLKNPIEPHQELVPSSERARKTRLRLFRS